jgi:hypothetical protein
MRQAQTHPGGIKEEKEEKSESSKSGYLSSSLGKVKVTSMTTKTTEAGGVKRPKLFEGLEVAQVEKASDLQV